MSEPFATTVDHRAIELAPRALVYLTVGWSVPELQTRPIIQAFLAKLPAALGVTFFAIQEDDRQSHAWLVSHGWADRDSVRGYGSLLWLEYGGRVDFELLPRVAGVERLLERTLRLWQR